MRGRGRIQFLLATGVFAVATQGCDANIGEPTGSPRSDAAPPADAPSLPDSSPADAALPDAAPCIEGDSQATDPESGACYALFQTGATWADARTACQALGGDLVSVTSQAEQDIVGPLSAESGELPDSWMGGTDSENEGTAEGTWVWVTGETFYQGGATVLYDNFREGEPNNSDNEDCLIIEGDRADLGYSWDDRDCVEQLLPYICER